MNKVIHISLLAICLFTVKLIGQNLSGQYYQFKSEKYFYVLEGDTIPGKFTDSNIVNGTFTQYQKMIFEGIDNTKIIINGTSRVHQKSQTHTIVKGQFVDGKRWGHWKITNPSDTAYSWEISRWANDVYYKKDTVVLSSWQSERYFIRDSTLVFGSHYLSPPDIEIHYRCEKDSDCLYWSHSKEKPITTSPFDELNWYIWLFERGEFDRKIKQNELDGAE